MLAYELTTRAIRDVRQARDWYDHHRVELGDRFIAAVLDAVRIACQRPESLPEVENGVRAVRCRRFPYRVYFEIVHHRIRVLAVYHTARSPQRWSDPDRT